MEICGKKEADFVFCHIHVELLTRLEERKFGRRLAMDVRAVEVNELL